MRNLSITKIGKVQKVFFMALCLNLLVGSVYWYIFVIIQQKNQHIAELTNSIETFLAQQDKFKANEKNVLETTSLRKQIDEYFISNDGVVSFLNSIQSLGTKNHLILKVGSVAIEPSVLSPDIFEAVRLNIEVSGAWTDVYRFVAQIELMPFKVDLNMVDLQKNLDTSKKTVGPIAPWKGVVDISVLKLK